MAERRADGEPESIEGPFLRVARRHSLCDDDAWEALGRGFEIAMRHRDRIRPDTATAWFATVVRHEASRVRRNRCRDLHLDPAHEPAPDEPEATQPDPRLPALRAAMRQLTPDQRRALILFYAVDDSRADGGRYRRIMRLSRAVRVTVAVVLRSDVDDMSLNEASLLPFGLPLRAAVACPRLLLCLHAARGASTC